MKKIMLILNAILCVALTFSIVKMKNLESQMNDLEYRLDQIYRSLYTDINEIYNNVDNKLEEQKSLFTTFNYGYGKIDIKNNIAEIICTAIPKEYDPNITQMKLVGNTEYSFKYDNGKYVAKFEIPLFETSLFEHVVLNDNGTKRSQKIDLSLEPRYNLIQTFAMRHGSDHVDTRDGYVWKIFETFGFVIDKDGKFNIKSIDVVMTENGKEVNRSRVDISYEGQMKYAEDLAKRDQAIPEHVGDLYNKDSTYFENHVGFIYPFNKNFELNENSEYFLYADIVDENNLTYRCFIDSAITKQDGYLDEERMYEHDVISGNDAIMIFDESGKILYEVDTNLYQ